MYASSNTPDDTSTKFGLDGPSKKLDLDDRTFLFPGEKL
jgi:hypothetical protein